MTKLSTRILHVLATDPGAAAASVLASFPDPDVSARCCNPTCTEPCIWEQGRNGPPPRFHDKSCRMEYARERRKLIELRDAYQRVIDEATPTYDQTAKLKRRVQAVQMQLDRYPSLD